MEINENFKEGYGGIIFGYGKTRAGTHEFVSNTAKRDCDFEFTIEYRNRMKGFTVEYFESICFDSKEACTKQIAHVAEGLKEFIRQENLVLPETGLEDVRKLYGGTYGSFEEAAAAFLAFAENPCITETKGAGPAFGLPEYMWAADPSGYTPGKAVRKQKTKIRKED